MRQPSTINLSQLPAPDVIETLDAERIIEAVIVGFKERWPQFTAVLESEPVIKLLEVFAYRELLLRNRVNAGAKALLIAYAIGTDLDAIGANFGVSRLVVTPATEDMAAVFEDDERFRKRIQLAPEAFSVAGPLGAYEFHALTVDPSLHDVHAYVPEPLGQAQGRVNIAVVLADGEAATDEQLSNLLQFFSREDVRPVTDVVTVERAERIDYEVVATLQLKRGPDPASVQEDAMKRLFAYAAERYAIGETVFVAGIVAALKAGGVDNVVLASPLEDVVCVQKQIPFMNFYSIDTQVL